MLAATYAAQMPNSPTHGADLTINLVMLVQPDKVVSADTPDPEPILPPEDPDPAEDVIGEKQPG